MKKYLPILCLLTINIVAQNSGIDSLFLKIQSGQINKKVADKAMLLSYNKIVNNLNTSSLIFESLQKANVYSNQPVRLGELKEKLALIKYLKGDYQMSSSLHLEAISLFEKSGDLHKKANAMATLAYQSKKRNIKSSLSLMHDAIEILKKSEGASFDLSGALDNYGVLFEMQGDLDSALHYYKSALNLKEKNVDSVGIPYSLNNIAGIYFSKKNIKEGLTFIDRSSLIRGKLRDYFGIAENESLLGELYFSLNNNKEAKAHFLKSNVLCKKVECIDLLEKNMKLLSNVYANEKKFDSAYYYYSGFFVIYDSIYNQHKQKEILEMETIYETEKKEKEKQALQSENQLSENTIKQQKVISYFIIGGLVIVSFLASFIFSGLKKQRKAYAIISKQKHIVEEKHKEITDSINYAERIQRSFIATKEILYENLNDHFVFFKPKDVVSGDFYWVSKLTNGNFALATADSTGHGVPGAIMSLLNVTSLEKAIETYTEPSDILNATRKIIVQRLKKDGSAEGGKDGMDCSLCVYDFKKKKLIVATANNPVWIVRGQEIIEIKPDKMPVGKHDKDNVSFTQQEIDLQKGDVVYTLTDGFPDQFGGEKGKKFMSKNLRELLSVNAQLPMSEQKEFLEQTFKNWVGNLEQVDDVTLIGVRI